MNNKRTGVEERGTAINKIIRKQEVNHFPSPFSSFAPSTHSSLRYCPHILIVFISCIILPSCKLPNNPHIFFVFPHLVLCQATNKHQRWAPKTPETRIIWYDPPPIFLPALFLVLFLCFNSHRLHAFVI